MIYRCMCCRSLFDEPDVMRRRENLDGERGVEWWTDLFCPECGAEGMYFEELEETEDG